MSRSLSRSRRFLWWWTIRADPSVPNKDGAGSEGSSAADARDQTEWLRLQYATAWELYRHEDQLAGSRNQVFVTIQAAVVATIAALAGPTTTAGGPYLLALLLVIASLFGLATSANWRRVTEAGRAYLWLRLMDCLAIEQWKEFAGEPLATNELRLRKAIRDGNYSYVPAERLQVDPIVLQRARGGWASTSELALGFMILWTGTLILAIGLLAATATGFVPSAPLSSSTTTTTTSTTQTSTSFVSSSTTTVPTTSTTVPPGVATTTTSTP